MSENPDPKALCDLVKECQVPDPLVAWLISLDVKCCEDFAFLCPHFVKLDAALSHLPAAVQQAASIDNIGTSVAVGVGFLGSRAALKSPLAVLVWFPRLLA